MASKAARPERPGEASPGEQRRSPDQAATGGEKSRNSQRDKATPADEAQPQFREALERKRAREAGTHGAPGAKDTGKIHGAHGPAMNRRSFRRKSG
jgi:hypothetical protein